MVAKAWAQFSSKPYFLSFLYFWGTITLGTSSCTGQTLTSQYVQLIHVTCVSIVMHNAHKLTIYDAASNQQSSLHKIGS